MYTLRGVTDADYDFLYNLHRAALRESIEATWGWVEEWQAEYFRKKWDPAKRQIIQINGRDAGVLVVEDRDGEHYLGLIEILPEFQGRGVGTAVIRDFIASAKQQHKPATLHTLKTNPKATRLYQRLGFAIVAEKEHKYKMRNDE